jgi:monoterpene epsilon-lactone hydrolase
MKINYFESTAEDRCFVENLLGNEDFARIYAGPQSASDMRTASKTILQTNTSSAVSQNVSVTACEIAGVPCERLTPNNAESGGIIVFLHGGGFVRGSLDLGRQNATELAALTGTPVVAVGYRQAPEHRFPAASQDVLNVYLSLLEQGYSHRAIVIVGESAGGCLALTLPTYHARGVCPLPAGLVGICPMADLRMNSASWYVNAARDIATLSMGQRMIDLYIDEADKGDPLAAPLNTPYSRDASILLCVGANEVMLSDVERLAVHAERAAARVTLNIYEAMPHGFTKFNIDMARQAMRDVAGWCMRRLDTAP